MPRLDIVKIIIAISILTHFSLCFPALPHDDALSLSPRADPDCFATTFSITDFKAFSGSETEPAFVSFKTGSKDVDGQLICSKAGEDGSTSPYFLEPLPCNKTGLPNIFFSYPEDRLLRVYQVTSCGTTK